MNVYPVIVALAVVIVVLLIKLARKQAELIQTRRYWLELQKWYEATDKVLDANAPTDATTPQADRVASLIAQHGNLQSELWGIDHLLKVPALYGKKTRYDKIAFSLAMNQHAAAGGKVSNKEADYN